MAKSWHGNLHLVYSKLEGKTHIEHSQMQAPLKVQRPFYPEGPRVCHSIILHTAGGMVGGDDLEQNITLKADAQALVTTAAAGKVYRSNGQMVQQQVKIKLAPGASLEWLPQETILFNGAVYEQKLQVELAPKANWCSWEITRLGRTARGEKFYAGQWRSHTEIWREGQPLWIDRQWLPGNESTFHSPHALASQPIVASFVWLGKPINSDLVNQAWLLWEKQSTTGEAGVTTIQGQGLLCRYRGSSTAEVKNWFIAVWMMLRPLLAYRSATTEQTPRVWQI